MTWLILASVLGGILAGSLGLLPRAYTAALDTMTAAALGLTLFGVGIDLGRSRGAWRELRKLGFRALFLPFCIAIGSLAGATLAGCLLGLPLNESSAIGAGFGWYSLSGVLLAQTYSLQTGALSFLTNVIRELFAVVTVPFLARHLGKMTAIAPGGATTMDTTLPIIARAAGPEAALLAFISGAVLSAMVPILIPLLIRL